MSDFETTEVNAGLDAENELKIAQSQLELYARDLKQTLDGLRSSESRLKEILETVPAILYRLKLPELQPEYISPAIFKNIGFQPEEFICDPKLWVQQIYEKDRHSYIDNVRRGLKKGANLHHEFRMMHKNGQTTHWFQDRARVSRCADGEIKLIYGALTDISESKRDKLTLEYLNETLKTISECNTSVIHAIDEQSLLDDICHNIVEIGGYRFVWIGSAQQDSRKSVKAVSMAGDNNGYLDEIHTSWKEHDNSRNPSGKAIRLAQVVVVPNFLKDSNNSPWLTQAVQRHYSSLIAIPIKVGAGIWGVLNIYSEHVNAFSEQQVRLFKGLADDIGYGMTVLRTRNERNTFAESLKQNEERLSMIIDNNADGILVLDKESNIQFMNPAARKLFLHSKEELLGKPFGFPVGTSETTEITVNRPNGEIRNAEMRTMATTWNGQPSYVISLHDYSERVQYEAERQTHLENLQNTLMETIRAMATALEKRDPYTAGHQHRVADLAVAIGKELKLSADRLNGLKMGSMIHDLGKIYVPAEILNRPGRLTPVEFELIKSHPEVGYDIVKDIQFPWPVDKMIYQHHERLDGSGYPQGLVGEEIILEARIIGIADVMEAMASHRPYRPGLGIDMALAELEKNAGKYYDLEIVKICMSLFLDKAFSFS